MIEIKDSPLKISREKKTIRYENEVIRDGECKEVKPRNPLKEKKMACNVNGKLSIKSL